MSLKLLWTVSTSALSSRGASQNEALACTLVGVSRSHVKCVHSNDRWRKPAVFSSRVFLWARPPSPASIGDVLMSLKLLWTVSTSALSSRGASQNEALACTLVGVSRSHINPKLKPV